MKNIRIKYILLPILLITFSFSLKAQSVTGTVSDQSGPLPGANVVVKGTSNGTTTDFDGNYTLNNVGTDATLVFSYIGFTPQEVPVNGQEVINVNLQEDLQSLDEVVVVGYGTQTRAAVTGAISSIGSEEMSALPVTNAEQALQGRAPGVTVVNSGSPGTSPVVRIRGLGTVGNNNPIYVIDGVITENLSGISPNDIESVNILKDASTTAIYGSRGSNGVVMVSTKKGKAGKPQLSFNAYSGFQTITQRFDLLNTEQYLQYASEAFGITPTNPYINAGIETDWQDEVFQNGLIQNYDLSLAGGNENANYRFSAGVLDQEGAIITTDFKRYSFRANSQFKAGKFEFGETMSIAFNNQTPEINNGGRSVLEHTIKSAPYLPVYNPNNPGGFQGPSQAPDSQDAENPVRILKLGSRSNKTTSIIGSIYGQFEILEGLKYKSQVGLDYYTFNNNRHVPSFQDGSYHFQNFAQITKNSGVGTTLIFTNSLNYQKTFGDYHNFDFLLLAEKFENTTTSLNASSRNELSNDVDQLSNSFSQLQSFENQTNRIGYLGRINYNYDSRYILALSLRRDASSRFGANNRWGWFPSVAAGWNIAKESFLEGSSISNLKFRGSWGVVGNDNIPNYQYSPTLTSDFYYPIGGNEALGTTANGLANPDLKWEETTMINVGLDFGILNDKFTASLEYYENESDGLLMSRTTPISLGFHQGNITENVGAVVTKGYELALGYNDFEGDFTWSANLNLGTSKNEVLSLGALGEITGSGFETGNISRITVGEPLFYFYGLVTDGIYQTQAEVDEVLHQINGDGTLQPNIGPGDIRYVDINNDGAITLDDKAKIGNPYPDITYGLNLTANYKQWDLNMFISGMYGNEIFNTNIYDLEGMPRLFNAGTAVLNRWTGPGTSNSVPRAFTGANGFNTELSDRYVEDGSFTRLKNLSIGYTLDGDMLADGISKLRLYLSGQNLITITDYSGLDPEIGQSPVFNGQSEHGIDRGTYPQPKSVLIGMQLTF